MRKNHKTEWEFKGNTYKVGDSLDEEWDKNNIYPIVWFEGRLFNAIIKPESRKRKDRIGLWDIYEKTKKPHWTTVDRVFQIIKTT